MMNYKKEGFDGQKAIVIPRSILNRFCLANEIIKGAYITDIGYYPKAKFHLRKRPQGAEQNILIYCVEGNGIVTIKSVKHTIVPGDFIVIPHGVSHSYETNEKTPWTIYWCHFKGDQADALVKWLYAKRESYKYSVEFVQERIALFDQLYTYFEQGYSVENLTYINLLLLQFLSSFIYSDKYKTKLSENNIDMLETSITFMQDNLEKSLTLSELAASVNLSNSHYSAIFRKKTGFAPIEYFNHLKIQKACQYLQFTRLRIREIAFKIGIEDPFYFSRLFTKTMGYGPKEYRETRYSAKQ
jgi:AraC-like DNA-binding protein/uncharacterized RmlC-like cupin family protein